MTDSTEGIVPAYIEVNSPAYAQYYAYQAELTKNQSSSITNTASYFKDTISSVYKTNNYQSLSNPSAQVYENAVARPSDHIEDSAPKVGNNLWYSQTYSASLGAHNVTRSPTEIIAANSSQDQSMSARYATETQDSSKVVQSKSAS
jgi:hypothetical protein